MACKEGIHAESEAVETVEEDLEDGECSTCSHQAEEFMAAWTQTASQWASSTCSHNHSECLLKAFGNIDMETANFLVESLEGAIEYEDAWEPLLDPFIEDTQAVLRILASDPLIALQRAKTLLDNPSSLHSSSESSLGPAIADSMRSLPRPSEEIPTFERFRNPQRTVMDGAHNRAVSLRQLRLLVSYLREHADANGFLPWTDWNPASQLTYGRKLHMQNVNMYHLVEFVIKPVTKDCKCSLVEILSDQQQQPPKWFVSHVWSEPLVNFLLSIEEHARVRGISEDEFYWVCSVANNQHSIDDDINIDPDPRKTSFYRAMQKCEGVLLCLDKDANPFNRIWCCFEEAMIVNGDKTLKLDISTVKDGKGIVLTDGLVESDFAVGPKYAHELKRERENFFPLMLLERGYLIDVREAKASHQADIRRILNAIIGVPASELDLREPNKNHPAFESTNHALRGIFAECAARKAAEAGRMERVLTVLRKDENRTTLTLNLGGCHDLDFTPFSCLAGHPNLQRIILDCAYCSIPNMEWIGSTLPHWPQLNELDFNFSCCSVLDVSSFGGLASASCLTRLTIDNSYSGLADVSGIGVALKSLTTLEELRLDFRWCSKLHDVAVLSEGLASLEALTELDLNFRSCDVVVALPGLEALNNLRSLSIDYSRSQTGTKELGYLMKLKNLNHLKLCFEGCKQLCHLSPLSVIGGYPYLERLSLDLASTKIGGAGALENLDLAPRLQEVRLRFAKCQRLKSIKWLPKAIRRTQFFQVDLYECGGLPPPCRGAFVDRDDLIAALGESASSSDEGAGGGKIVVQTPFAGEIKHVNQAGRNVEVEVHRMNSANRTSSSTSNSKSKQRERRRNNARFDQRDL
ncbi:expressed unknown protein [Seminavis robusta]|uniref:Uncharacterized protein n=1 Tax=Seminavis robusta TaxID=568900 RepID=A0A9N8EC86_9STRA|nr:expressed unknown protein [Seminavis robusta]|eukprot:Sro869_g213520.1 n/a (863) ;mRNA; r:34517-37105